MISETELLVLAIVVFSLMCVGLGLTIREFQNMEKEDSSD